MTNAKCGISNALVIRRFEILISFSNLFLDEIYIFFYDFGLVKTGEMF